MAELDHPHLDAALEEETTALARRLLDLAAGAERMVADAITSFVRRDPELARRVIAADEVLDALEVEVDERAVRLLARFAPVGGDLRLAVGALKLSTDLERIGDQAVNVAKRSLSLSPGGEVPRELVELSQVAAGELSHALTALARRDPQAARRVFREDHDTDDKTRAAFERLHALGGAEPVPDAIALAGISRALERIGDHAVNVAEIVLFLTEGKLVRHASG